jgi:branched-chain amino acid transport system permease protein
LLGLLTAVLRFTSLGRSIKATRSNPEMALLIGIDPARIYLVVFAIASLFAGVAATFAAMKFAVEPTMGFRPVVLAFVVAFLGGTASSPVRVFLTGITIGLIETISSIWLSVRWNQLIVFVILVLYLVSLSFNRSMFTRVRMAFAGQR